MSVAVERELGHLPIDSHLRAIADLAGTATGGPPAGMARFLLRDRDPTRHLGTMLRGAGRILVPSLGWIGAMALAILPAVAAVLCWEAAPVVLPPDGPSADRLRLLGSALVLALVPAALDDGRQFTVPMALLLVLRVPQVRLPVRLAGPVAVVTSLALGVLGWTLRPRRRERPPRPLRPAR